jgi:hypothetical protein
MKKKKQKMPLTPKITFIGGKWYNELGKEVPKPQPKPVQGTGQFVVEQAQGQLQRYGDDEIFERLANCTCTRPQSTGHVPGCVHFADALYVCERGNRETIAQLAKLADTTISDLERRRIDFVEDGKQHFNGPDIDCPDRISQNDGRRRCWRCPYWTRHADETPFDHQKTEMA